MPFTIESARALARERHGGQTDKQGRDYYEAHLVPIAALLSGFGEHAEMAGLLHDVVEDTPETVDSLRRQDVPDAVVTAVDSVTKREGEDYSGLIARAAVEPLGSLVKLADNTHNLAGVNAVAASDPETAERLRAKYTAARVVLLEAVARHGWDLGDGPLGAVAP